MSPRPRKYLSTSEIDIVDRAVSVSEDVVGDHFQLTIASWKKYRYDIRTLHDLTEEEIVADVFAQVVRYQRPTPPGWQKGGDFYRICLQDHNILAAIRRDPHLELYPLLVYVFTHELVHIVRFYKFVQSFHADGPERDMEEARVHKITCDLLQPVKIPRMGTIIEYYREHGELVL